MIFLWFILNYSSVQAQEMNLVPSAVSIEDENLKNTHALTFAITAPQPLALGYQMVFPDLPQLHFFAEGGYFYLPLSGRLKKLSVWSVQAGVKYFPFEGRGWNLGGSFGFRQMGIGTDISNLKLDGVSLANNADLTLNVAFFAITSGWQWQLGKKTALAVDLGVQLPLPGLHGGNTNIEQDVSDGSDLGVDDEDALNRITNIPLPQIALIRFIWYID